MVPASRVDASGLEGGDCGNHCSFGKRCSVREEFLTGVVARPRRTSTRSSERKKKKESVIYD